MAQTQTADDALTPAVLVEQALDLVQAKSLKRREVAWETLRPTVLAQARDSETLEQAYDLIRDVLKQLGDNHSFLWTAAGKRRLSAADYAGFRLHQDEPVIINVCEGSPAAAHGLRQGDRIVAVNGKNVARVGWRSLLRLALRAGTELTVYRTALKTEATLVFTEGVDLPNLYPRRHLTPDGFGVLELPGHMGDGTLPEGHDYARVVQDYLHEFEAAGARGWVIDLRRNDGGNMWPMLAGLTPLLGATEYGSFFDPVDEVRWLWRFDGEQLGCYREDQPELPYEPIDVPGGVSLKKPDAPVAVLCSRVTSSSGEATLLSFLGRPRTRTFGLPTGGLATSNGTHELADGSSLLLTDSLMADRLGRVYEDGVVPDERVDIAWEVVGEVEDPVVRRAEAWLENELGRD